MSGVLAQMIRDVVEDRGSSPRERGFAEQEPAPEELAGFIPA